MYILRSLKDKKLYIGYTPDLKKRFKEHNQGKVLSTKPRVPFELLAYEAFSNKKDALEREKFFKTGWGRKHLRKTLKHVLG